MNAIKLPQKIYYNKNNKETHTHMLIELRKNYNLVKVGHNKQGLQQ